MDQDERALRRPRGRAWGNEAQRAVLHAIAEDVARRSGHRVAAIEALRSDGNLEFVAVAGNPAARERLLGSATPLDLDRVLGRGSSVQGWVHVPAERLDAAGRAWVEAYGHTPDAPHPHDPTLWHPEDRLVRLLLSPEGELRALLYLDEPRDGRRPTEAAVAAINDEVHAMYDAIVGIVERELYGEQVRMATQARSALRSVPPDVGLRPYLDRASDAMVEAMDVDTVDVLLAGESAAPLGDHQAELEEHMRQVWLRGGHLVLEPEQAWGIGSDAVPTPPVMSDLMAARGIGSWLLVPIGAEQEYLGTMGLGRAPGSPRWADSEVNAASVVAGDLADVVVGTRLIDRERELNAELRDVDDYRRDMILTLAHELRNPVSVLFTHLELLDLGDVAPEDRDSLAALGRATRRIEVMVEDLMALASASDPDAGDPAVPVELSGLVDDVADFLATTAVSQGIRLRLDVAPGLVVAGDEAALHRVVANLVSNALKYTPSGGRVTVRLEPEPRDGVPGALLTCADTGIGITPGDLVRIFEPFYRSRSAEARLRPGTGLGLAIVEQVVEHHGGTVDVDSEVGKGTTFRVWLPRVEDGPAADASTPGDVRPV